MVSGSQALQLLGPVLNQHQVRGRRRVVALIDEDEAFAVTADVPRSTEHGRYLEEASRDREAELIRTHPGSDTLGISDTDQLVPRSKVPSR